MSGIVYSNTRKRTLNGITGKPEVNEVDGQAQIATRTPRALLGEKSTP